MYAANHDGTLAPASGRGVVSGLRPARSAAVSAELVAIVVATAALAGLILRQGARLDARIDRLEKRIDSRIDRLERDHADLRERIGRIEGMMDGLREAMGALREAAAALREALAGRRGPGHAGAG